MTKSTLFFIVYILVQFIVFNLQAEIIHVTTTEDGVPGSLRAAITTVNNNNENNTIYVPAGTFILTGDINEDQNISGDLDINTNYKVNIIGKGTGYTIIDANQGDRVFHILKGIISISRLTIRNGKTRNGDSVILKGEDGGGICNFAELILNQCNILNNRTGCGLDSDFSGTGRDGGNGGGIFSTGSLELKDCMIKYNQTGAGGYGDHGEAGNGGHGGGIYSTGSLNLQNCALEQNTSGKGGSSIFPWGSHTHLGDGGNGGGIYITGKLTLTNSKIIQNSTGSGGEYGADGDWGGSGGNGGGIFSTGNQTIKGCQIRENKTGDSGFTDRFYEPMHGGHGGGLFISSGNHLIENTFVSDNSTGKATDLGDGGHGGGIFNQGSLKLQASTVTNNNTGTGLTYTNEYKGGGGDGGGIFNKGDLTLIKSNISSNSTGDGNTIGFGGDGAGIFNKVSATITDCTISKNSCGDGHGYSWHDITGNGGDGGGIHNSNTLNLTNCTIYSNTTGTKGQHSNENSRDGYGGGVYNDNGTVTIKNTILANNEVPKEGEGPDGWGILTSEGYNLIKNTKHYTITGDLTGNILGVDPKLGPLTDNGGPTHTLALRPGSPAIDAGDSSGISKDQRGYHRPVDISDISNVSDGADIGAFEYQSQVPYSISGYITCNGKSLPNVTLTFSNSGGSTTTEKNGDYNHRVVFGWSGTVTPSKTNYTFTPIKKTYNYITQNQTKQNYTAVLNTQPPTPSKMILNRTQFNFGASTSQVQTGAQILLINDIGSGTLNWIATPSENWIVVNPQAGTGNGIVNVSIDATGMSPGDYTGTITVSDANAINSPQTVTVALKVHSSTNPPFGSFDTPIDGSTVYGSIPVTGWVLDDIQVEKISIFREEGNSTAFIGEAILVDGARPDIEMAYPDYPNNYQAGWGYMMLTNFLPNGGNGTFIIKAMATDTEGNQVTLGTRTITCDNANAVKPFGAIDTPTPGSTASGSGYVNFGWALTPQPNTISIDGSTITVWVDGVPLGHPVYNQYREDIATKFPGYNNSQGAVGYFYLDTTTYDNGVHTIAWSVTDDAGNTDGVGSRYFTIVNTDSGPAQIMESASLKTDFKGSDLLYENTLKIKIGFNRNSPWQAIHPDGEGVFHINLDECENLRIKFSQMKNIQGLHVKGNEHCQLPIGSSIVNNSFNWLPGPGFRGLYELEFFEHVQNNISRTIKIKVNIE